MVGELVRFPKKIVEKARKRQKEDAVSKPLWSYSVEEALRLEGNPFEKPKKKGRKKASDVDWGWKW